MKKRMVIAALVITLFAWSTAHAFDGCRPSRSGDKYSRQELLAQLPADKEIFFHKSMREASDKTSAMHTQIKQLRKDIKEILVADQFDEDLFLKKTNSLETLKSKIHVTMEGAIVKLAKQFTSDERKILVQLLPRKLCYATRLTGRKYR